MFTPATRAFGIWKDDHPSHRRHTGSPTLPLVTALGICAFLCWLVFFLTLRIRGEFFVLENDGLRLAKIDARDAHLSAGRQAAVRFGVRKRSAGGLALLFDSGRVLEFPRQETAIRALVDARAEEMERTGLLTLVANPAIARAQIWPEADVPPAELGALVRFLTDLGYDDFDIAMEVE